MVRRAAVLAALVAVAAAAAGCPKPSCPQTATTVGPAADDQVADVLRTIEQWRQAYEVRSTEALHALYDHGKSVAVVIQGVAVVGWDAVQADLDARLARASSIHLRIADIRVSPVGGGAIATASLSREITEGATSVADTGTLTLVFATDGDKLLIVAEHFSFRPR
jgi:ketosteroid isomerase-like protein